MICCDICKKEAIYFYHIDYLRDKNTHSFDLCEEHNQKILEFYSLLKENREKPESLGRKKLAIPK